MLKLAFQTVYSLTCWVLSAVLVWVMTVLGIITFVFVTSVYILGSIVVGVIDSIIEFLLDTLHIKRGKRGN